MLSPQQLIAGKYRILRLIGEGGMGNVYEARHEVLGHHVALKFLHPEIARQPNLQQRFLQEARLSASINNPHIVRVSDVDTVEEGAYLVMELLQGEPLQSLLDRERVLPPERAVAFTLQILQGLAAAHALGVVHRDLKPDNVFITPSPYGSLLKILDFGIAKLRATEEYQMTLTRPGAVMGTPEYMAPEQAYSADLVDERSDLYSVGVMLFEMLSGKLPIEGDSPQKIAEMAIKGQVRSLAQLAPQLPPPLIDIVTRAIKPVPEQRWANVQQLQQALLPWAALPSASMLPVEDYRRSSVPVAAPYTGKHNTPVVPREELQRTSYAHVTRVETRLSNVPATVAQDGGPPAVTQQEGVRVKTASMPETALPNAFTTAPTGIAPNTSAPNTTAPGTATRPTAPPLRPKRKSSAGVWWVLALFCLGAGGAFAWYYNAELNAPVPPPQPTRRVDLPVPSAPLESLPEEDFESDPSPRVATPEPRPGPGLPPNPGTPVTPSAVPALPPIELPTSIPLPALPTSLPQLPSSIQLPFPIPGITPPKQAAPPASDKPAGSGSPAD